MHQSFVINPQNTFERVISQDKRSVLDDVLNRIFDVCVSVSPIQVYLIFQSSNEITVDQFGKGIGVFTSKRLQINPTKDLFFTLDREVRGAIGEKEITNYAADTEKKGFSKNLTKEIQEY